MFNFDKITLPSKKIKERRTSDVTQMFGDFSGVICTTCQRKLQNEESMIAGMGAVCRERARFAEKLSRKDLASMEGKQEPISKGLYPSRNVILRLNNEESPRFVSVISVENWESVMMDRTEMDRIYNKTGSMAKAISQSMYGINPRDAKSVAPAILPSHPNIRKFFNKFRKKDRQEQKQRLLDLKISGIDKTNYQLIDSKKSLNETQLSERNNLIIDIESNPEKRERFNEGHYHLSTIYSRLDNVFMDEAVKLKKAIYDKDSLEVNNVEEKDYGLTDYEILDHLSTEKIYKKTLIEAFFKGNKNLDLMIEIYNKSKFEKGLNKLKSLKSIRLLEDKEISPESKSKLEEVFSILKIDNSKI